MKNNALEEKTTFLTVKYRNMKLTIYLKLTSLRDKRWMPMFMIRILDWFRYEVFYPEENYG